SFPATSPTQISTLSLHDALPISLPTGAVGLRTMSFGFVLYALGFVLTQAFNGAGDTWTPTWINLACFWLWEIPLAYVQHEAKTRSEEHTSELQSRGHLVCRLLLE